MGKKKDSTTAKIKQLKSRAEKITTEQLEKAKKIVSDLNQTQHRVGILETQKHQVLHAVAGHQDELALLRSEFQNQYGSIDINLEDGTIKYEEDGGAN